MSKHGTGLGVMRLAEVRLQEGESIENALRRFKRKVQTSGGLLVLPDEFLRYNPSKE